MPVITEFLQNSKVEHTILEGLVTLLDNDCTLIEVTALNEHQAQQLFHSWLERDRRRLTPLQLSWLQSKSVPFIPLASSFEKSEPAPLFLSLFYDIALAWHSFDDQPNPHLYFIQTTGKAIAYLYERMSRKHGKVLFRYAMTYLQLAGGLNENELEDLLSADITVLRSIFLHYLPPLSHFRLPSSLWLSICNDMRRYLVGKDVDHTSVIYL